MKNKQAAVKGTKVRNNIALAGVFLCFNLSFSMQVAFFLSCAFFVAVLFLRQKFLLTVLMFVIPSVAHGLENLICTALACVIAVLFIVLLRLSKRSPSQSWQLLTALLTQLLPVAFFSQTVQDVFVGGGVAIGGVCFCLISSVVLKVVFVKGLRFALVPLEKFCLSIFVMALSLGVCNIFISGIAVGFCLLVLAAFGVCFSLGGNAAMAFCLLSSMGFLPLDMVQFATSLCVCGIFCMLTGEARVATLAFPALHFGLNHFFFDGGDIAQTVALLLVSLFFLLVPRSMLDSVKKRYFESRNFLNRSMVQRSRKILSKKLFDLSEVFLEMKLCFCSLLKGGVSQSAATSSITQDLRQSVCSACQQHNICWRNNVDKTEQAFFAMVSGALEKGKMTIYDFPALLTERCKKLSLLHTGVTGSIRSFFEQSKIVADGDNNKLVMGEQLAGVSKILLELSRQNNEALEFDKQKESRVFEALSLAGILTKEVAMAEGNKTSLSLVVERHADIKKATKVLSGLVGRRVMIGGKSELDEFWQVLTFVDAPKYDVKFGFAADKKDKSEMSGDTHTFLRIDEGRFLVALCDGMGSGLEAHKMSSTSIGLIENFYKAGFDNETILSCANKMLAINQEESFAAVDIAVIDINQGLADFIKIGSPYGFVLSGAKVEEISTGALPLGLLEDIKPCITKKVLKEGDTVVLATDGVWDAFGNNKQLIVQKLNGLAGQSAQDFADNLLADAQQQNTVVEDDMSVLVVQIFENT